MKPLYFQIYMEFQVASNSLLVAYPVSKHVPSWTGMLTRKSSGLILLKRLRLLKCVSSFIFAWRTYPELQWEMGTADLVSLLFSLFVLLVLQLYNMASASVSPDIAAALKENNMGGSTDSNADSLEPCQSYLPT